MNKIVPAIASAILLTVASSSLATAELKLDTRHDIAPIATHTTAPAAQPERTADAPKTVPQPASRTQVAAANHQASAAEPPPRPKVQRKARPRYAEPVIVFRPVYRPVFGGFRFGRRW